MFSNITLCDSTEDDESGEGVCVRTGAAVKRPAPVGLGQVWIFRLWQRELRWGL